MSFGGRESEYFGRESDRASESGRTSRRGGFTLGYEEAAEQAGELGLEGLADVMDPVHTLTSVNTEPRTNSSRTEESHRESLLLGRPAAAA